MNRVFFTADTHFSHKNILLHCPNRASDGNFDINDLKAHNEWLIDRWNSCVDKKDLIYVIGDFAFGPSEDVKKILGKLRGQKYLILGNHDGSSDKLEGYFKQITQIKHVTFKKSNFEFLDEDLQVSMCHYPMVTWASKHYGCIQLHGHCHGRLDNYNNTSTDLRVDVGIDSGIANYSLVSLEQVYEFFKSKTNGESFLSYAQKMKDEGHPF